MRLVTAARDGCGPIPPVLPRRSSRPTGRKAPSRSMSPGRGVTRRRRCMDRVRCASAFPRPRRRARLSSSTPRRHRRRRPLRHRASPVGEGSRLAVTTAAAEKVYRAQGPTAEASIALKAADGAHLGWLPQETILFDRARCRGGSISTSPKMHRCCSARSSSSADQRWASACWQAICRPLAAAARRRLVFAETVRLDGDIGDSLAKPAVANGGVAIGTALIVPGDEAWSSEFARWQFARAAKSDLRLEWICNGPLLCPRCGKAARRYDGGARRAWTMALPRLWLD